MRATSAYEPQGGKLTLQLAWLARQELVTVHGTRICYNWKTGQHSNLDFNGLILLQPIEIRHACASNM